MTYLKRRISKNDKESHRKGAYFRFREAFEPSFPLIWDLSESPTQVNDEGG